MRTDFSKFRERLAVASQARQMPEPQLAASIGLTPRRPVALSLTGPGGLDLDRVCQIADILDVSLDWLTGRSNIMDLLELPEEFEHRQTAPSAKRARKKDDDPRS
jgi:hypothetical protein